MTDVLDLIVPLPHMPAHAAAFEEEAPPKPRKRLETTSALRVEWAPHCSAPLVKTLVLRASENLDADKCARVTVRSACLDAFRALDAVMVAYDYRLRRADTGAYVCRAITGGTGYSLHAYGIAGDFNWQTNPYGKRLITDMPAAMVRDIKAIGTRNGERVFRWGGDYRSNKDAMHFEVVCEQEDLVTGIDPRTFPGTPKPPDPAPFDEESDMFIGRAGGKWWLYLPHGKRVLLNDAERDRYTADGVRNLGDVPNAVYESYELVG